MDQNYLPVLRTMLFSLHVNNPDEPCTIYLLHSSIPEDALTGLQAYLEKLTISLYPICVDAKLFSEAKVTDRYPAEMYYRMLAGYLLPESVHRVLYLDPDLLIINPLHELWNMDLSGYMFAAASHIADIELINEVNKLRLSTTSDYFNSGVILMNLDACRREIHSEDIFRYVKEHEMDMMLPDQDVLNALYGTRISPLDDFVWNFDARHFDSYYLASGREKDESWVMEHTSILHFCVRAKLWKKGYHSRFGVLYKHYEAHARKLLEKDE